MRTPWVDWLLTAVAGAVGVVVLMLAVARWADGDRGWAVVLAVLALPGLVAAYRAMRADS